MNIFSLLLTAAGSVFFLFFLVMRARMHAFVALILVSFFAGVLSGMPLEQIGNTMQKGMSGTLGFLSIVVALGAIFGKILYECGVVNQIALYILKRFGARHSPYAMGCAGLICALPLFFEVAVVLLISIAFAVANRTGENLVKLVIPLFAGVAAAAAFLVPGPAPMLLASQMHVDLSWMLLLGLCAAIPGMLIAGPVFGHYISHRVKFIQLDLDNQSQIDVRRLPSFGWSIALLLFPLILVAIKTFGLYWVPSGTNLYAWFQLIGHPFAAILLSCLVAIYGLAPYQGIKKEEIMQICTTALQPAGVILLVIGAGGVFKQILIDSGVGPELGNLLTGIGLPVSISCFLLAGAVRIIQGSATVACLTAVGLLMPVIELLHYSGAQMAALAICIAGGSIVCSHVNDAGFWLFSRFTGATEGETLITWTIMETILGLVGSMVGMIAFSLFS
ncbi:Low-affinity gluconate transporter [Candidatus Erwinia haradaeae]|uniref:Low-affinity gluconate transporter n=1 Tax=Candidatus Erwinia haradaeae TaxID=1922217 RepID=A0A451CYH1_9GAMM|nr:gluconate transporter [Candidatus Erwinia haradaeae]VFP78387.1 Low-affinity gluconate transporter [Candidatus Erwinia haradaeae]